MQERKPEAGLAQTGLVEIKTIGVEKAIELRDLGIETAKGIGVSGFLAVFSRTGMQECSQAMDKATPLNVQIALDKIKTVLAVRRSTSLQRKRMEESGQSRDDFAGQLGSLFDGGVAIFADEDHTQFVGAIGFSGGTPEQDEEICKKAVEKSGLYTDLPKNTREPKTIHVEDDIFLMRIVFSDSEAMFALIDKNRDHLSQFSDETAKKYPTLESVVKRNSTQSPNEKRFGIWDKNKFVGFVKVTQQKDKGWEIGYWMGSEYTGKGYMTKAVSALTDYAINSLGASYVFAKVDKGNIASLRVLARAGYESKGTNPENESEFIWEFRK